MDGVDSLYYFSVIYFIFRIGPGAVVGASVGARVDQESGVDVGVGFGTVPPRLHTPAQNFHQRVPRAILTKIVLVQFIDGIFVTHSIPEGNNVTLIAKVA